MASDLNYAVKVMRELINNKWRFTFYCLYNTNTDNGMGFYNNILPNMKRWVERDCQNWTIEGYPYLLQL